MHTYAYEINVFVSHVFICVSSRCLYILTDCASGCGRWCWRASLSQSITAHAFVECLNGYVLHSIHGLNFKHFKKIKHIDVRTLYVPYTHNIYNAIQSRSLAAHKMPRSSRWVPGSGGPAKERQGSSDRGATRFNRFQPETEVDSCRFCRW